MSMSYLQLKFGLDFKDEWMHSWVDVTKIRAEVDSLVVAAVFGHPLW